MPLISYFVLLSLFLSRLPPSFFLYLSSSIVHHQFKGLWETSGGGFQTHTHFLTTAEWDILKGFSKRGMFFARKFSTKKTPELLDLIDNYMLLNQSSEAGLYWPGFYEVDTTTPGRQWVQAHNKRKKDEMILKKKNRNNEINNKALSASSFNASLSENTLSTMKDKDVRSIDNSGKDLKKVQKKIFLIDKSVDNKISIESDPGSTIIVPNDIGVGIEGMKKKRKGKKKKKHYFSSLLGDQTNLNGE